MAWDGLVKMNEGFLDFGIIAKMDPMARRATASMEAMQNAIAHNNMDDVAKHIEEAKNALSVLERDLNLAKSPRAKTKSFKAQDKLLGMSHAITTP